jgi:glycosyltransferase involved in cell wall biosynthesis
MIVAQVKLGSVALRHKKSIIHFHDPELLPLSIFLRLFGYCLVYDAHEDVGRQLLSKPYIPLPLRGAAAKIVRQVEALAGQCLNGIVAATPAIASRFNRERVVTVQNFPINTFIDHVSLEHYLERENRFGYVGALTELRGVCEIVAAIGLVPKQFAARLSLAGTFDSSGLDSKLKEQEQWQQVDFGGWITPELVPLMLAQQRAGLVLLHPTPAYMESYPIKLYEYMAAGLPVIASDFPLWREIVGRAQCGLLVNPLDVSEIASAMTWILQHPEESMAMGKRGRAAVLEKYNWVPEQEKLLTFYNDIERLHFTRWDEKKN